MNAMHHVVDVANYFVIWQQFLGMEYVAMQNVLDQSHEQKSWNGRQQNSR